MNLLRGRNRILILPEHFLGNGKICCQISSKSLNIIKYWIFFQNSFKSLINTKDPDSGGQLIMDPSDLDPQHCHKERGTVQHMYFSLQAQVYYQPPPLHPPPPSICVFNLFFLRTENLRMLYMIFRGKCGGCWQRGRSTHSSKENSFSGNC